MMENTKGRICLEGKQGVPFYCNEKEMPVYPGGVWRALVSILRANRKIHITVYLTKGHTIRKWGKTEHGSRKSGFHSCEFFYLTNTAFQLYYCPFHVCLSLVNIVDTFNSILTTSKVNKHYEMG